MLAEGLDPAGSELDVPLFFWLRSRLSDHAATDAQIRRLYAVARHDERLCDPSGYVDDGLLLGEAARVAGVSTLASLTARQMQDLYDAIEPDGAERRRQGHALLAALERRPGGGRERDGAARWPARP
jgi:hypothetical protein